MPSIVVVTDHYHPDDVSTGYFLTGIAEGLARQHDVRVICGQPARSERSAQRRETRNGVSIRRVGSIGQKDGGLVSRAIRTTTLCLFVLTASLARLRRGDIVIVVTNPPALPLVVRASCRLRGARCVVLVHDLYPDVLIATGFIKRESRLVAVLEHVNRWLYSGAERIVVLGRDMRRLVARWRQDQADGIVIIPNWGDIDLIRPLEKAENELLAELGLTDRFIVQASGNFGRTHDVATVLEAARRLVKREDIHFIFSGWGKGRVQLEESIGRCPLPNVTLLKRQPRGNLSTLLNAADLIVIPFIPGMAGVSVPSRMYNVMAAGRSILAAVDADAELALVVREEGIGWTTAPQDVDQMVAAIEEAAAARELIRHQQTAARQAAETSYSYDAVINAYSALVDGMTADTRPASDAPR